MNREGNPKNGSPPGDKRITEAYRSGDERDRPRCGEKGTRGVAEVEILGARSATEKFRAPQQESAGEPFF